MRGENRAPVMYSLASHFSDATLSVVGDFNECGPATLPMRRREKNVVAPTTPSTANAEPYVAHDSASREVQHG